MKIQLSLIIAAIILTTLLSSVGISKTLADFGCQQTGGQWYCPDFTYIDNVKLKLTDNVGCYSSIEGATCTNNCASIVDIGCFAIAQVLEDKSFQVCQKKITNSTVESGYCRNEKLSSGDGILLALDPNSMDYSNCQKTSLTSIYSIECPMNGIEMTANLAFYGENDTAFVISYSAPTGVGGFVSDNLLYIVLVVIVIIVAYWALYQNKGKSPKRGVRR